MSAWTVVVASLPAWLLAAVWVRAVRRERRLTAQTLSTRAEFDAIVLRLADLDAL